MKRLIIVVLALAIVGGLIGWRLYTKKQDTQAQAQARTAAQKAAPPVDVAPVAVRDITQVYVGVGSVEAPFSVKIAPKVSGRLDFLQVREGAIVTQGEELARIDPSQIQAQVSQQQATIAEAQSRLAQAQYTQSPTNVSVATQIQQNVAGLESARADANQTRQNYNSQVAAAQAAVTDAQGRIDSANATIANAQANIRSAQANLTNAQVRYNRTYDLYKQGFVAAQDVDDARTTVKVEEEAVGVARGQLNSAQAARDSAVAQKESAQHQASIVAVKGKADIAAANAKVAQAAAGLKFAQSNVAQRPAYAANLAALRATVNAANAQLRNLQSQLSDTILLSPVTGFVTARYVDPGAIVSPSQPVLNVESIKEVFVTISVPEEVVGHLHLTETGTVTFDAMPGRNFTGRITQINPAADPQSRQFPVRITLNNPDYMIKPGMFARVSLVTQRVTEALVVPREAVQRGKNGATVVVVDGDGVAHRRMVHTGAEDASGIQITQGVQPKELVVTLTNANIKDGQKVRLGNVGKPGANNNPPLTAGGGAANPSAQSNGSGSPTAANGSPAGSGNLSGGPINGSGSAAGQASMSGTSGSGNGAAGVQSRSNGGVPGAPGSTGTTSGAQASGSSSNGQAGSNGTTSPTYGASQNAIPNNPPQIQTPTPSSVPSGQNPGAGSGAAAANGSGGFGAGGGSGSGAGASSGTGGAGGGR